MNNEIQQLEKQINELQNQVLQLKKEKEERKRPINKVSDLIKFLKKEKCLDFISGEEDLNRFDILDEDLKKLGNFKKVYSDSEYNDGNDSIVNVYYFEQFNAFIQFEGFYTSYEGHAFENCYQVEPEEYIAIRYNQIKTKD